MSQSRQAAQDGDDVEDRKLRVVSAQGAHQRGRSFERDVYEYLAETDALDPDEVLEEFQIPEHLKSTLRLYLTRDWPLAYLDDAGYNEMKWELRIHKEMIYQHYPPPDCLVTGEDRAAINDDPEDLAEPLTRDKRVKLEAIFVIARNRLTRAKEMKQQEVVRTNIAETNVNRGERQNNGGGIRQWLSRRT